MEGNVHYNTLDEGISKLSQLAQAIDEPISNYQKEASQIGESEDNIWGGTAAASAEPILAEIKKDIVALQSMISTFASKAGVALENYAQADIEAKQAMENLQKIA